jgi:hypothetical protein
LLALLALRRAMGGGWAGGPEPFGAPAKERRDGRDFGLDLGPGQLVRAGADNDDDVDVGGEERGALSECLANKPLCAVALDGAADLARGDDAEARGESSASDASAGGAVSDASAGGAVSDASAGGAVSDASAGGAVSDASAPLGPPCGEQEEKVARGDALVLLLNADKISALSYALSSTEALGSHARRGARPARYFL